MKTKSIPSYTIDRLKAPQSAQARRDFELFLLEYFVRDIDHLQSPHRHEFFSFILVTAGTGSHDIDFETFELRQGRLFQIAPDQVHSWNEMKDVKGYVLLFTDSFVALSKGRRLLSSWPLFRPGQECYVDLTRKETGQWIIQFAEMAEELSNNDNYRDDALFYSIGKLLVRASRLYNKVSPNRSSSDILFKFQRLIEKHFSTLKSPRDYARLLHITPNYLNGYCREHAGKSAGELIRQRVLLEAKRLLAHTSLPVAQVGYELNFDDNSYFGRFFKRYVGETPDNFRSRHRK